jgi:hypothetical protein
MVRPQWQKDPDTVLARAQSDYPSIRFSTFTDTQMYSSPE